jgi:RND family efflux transporter MFP subunit
MSDDTGASSESVSELEQELTRLRLLHKIGQEFSASLDFDELLPKVFNDVLNAVGAQAGAIWIAEGENLRCRLALGGAGKKLVGAVMPIGSGFVGDVARKQRTTVVTHAMNDPRFEARVDRSTGMFVTDLMATPMVAQGVTVGAIQVSNKVDGSGIFDENDRALLEGLAASAAVALRNAQLHTAEKRARDLALLLEISREVTSTLDIERVLQSVVNLAAKPLAFDRAAVALLKGSRYEVRALAGEEKVDAKEDRMVRLAARGAWAVQHGGVLFYFTNRAHPPTDPERAFASAFAESLEADKVGSGLYIPLRDEEGTLGVLILEAERVEFAAATQIELAQILANQTAVALRNAQLYEQVPLADALGAIAARKRAFMSLPRQRRLAYGAVAVALVGGFTLIRWPLRVDGSGAAFRPSHPAVIRAAVGGTIEDVLVREGTAVERGTPLVRLRDTELRATRAARAADLDAAQRSAAIAASRGDAAGERLSRSRADALTQEVALLDEQLAAMTLRAPVSGVVLTPRPEERLNARVIPGDPVLTVGRLDTLELEFGVSQREITRVAPGQPVRLRVDALPQRTFRGEVRSVSELPVRDSSDVDFAVRAAIPNPDGLLKPGMPAHAVVLTAPTSAAVRLFRGPVRWLRLTWWRLRT